MTKEGESQADVSTSNNKTPMSQKNAVLTWDQYFMGVALIAAQRNKDPNKTKVGACIVNEINRIVGIGYNEMPDIGENSSREEPESKKRKLVCHAETNAIVKTTGADIQNCKLYTTLYPCNECSKLMIQSGIRKVVHLKDADPKNPTFIASKKILETANVKIKKYQPKDNMKSLSEALEEL